MNAGGTTGMGQPRTTGPDGALPFDGPQAALPGDAQTPGRKVIKSRPMVDAYDSTRRRVGLVDEAAIVQKADGDEEGLQAIFDQEGNLVGAVKPSQIIPISGGNSDASAPADADGDGTDAAPPADADTDMTPMPAAETGTPADMPADDNVTKQDTITRDVLKSTIAEALAQLLAAQGPAEDVAKQADVAGLLEEVATLKARLATVEEQPAAPKVFTNGQLPPAHQMRGQDQGAAPQVDVAKALDLKHQMYTADPARAKEIHDDLNQMARDQLAVIHRR